MSQIGSRKLKILPGTVVQSITGNAGGAVSPSLGNNINILGVNNITVTGVPLTNTLNISVTGTTNHAVQVGNATGSLTSLPLALTGQGLMGTTGADPAWTGSPSFSGTVTAGTGLTATTGNVTITSGNLTLPTTTSLVGQIIVNAIPFMHSYGTDNLFLGANSGNFTLDATNAEENVGIGGKTLFNLTGTGPGEATLNTAIGYGVLQNCTIGSGNTSCGALSASALTIGNFNTNFGELSLNQLVSGNYCTVLGVSAGHNYTTNESSNICIGYNAVGTIAESNVLRIGVGSGTGNGQLNAAYISGIYNKTVGATSTVVLSDSNDQIGGLPSGTSGYVLTQGATAPSWQPTLPGGINWTRETNAAVAAVINHGYINTNVGLTTITLPATAAIGSIIEVVGESAAGWTIVHPVAGHYIQYGNLATTVNTGSLSSSNRYDTIRLICRVADTVWHVTSSTGILNIV